MIDPLAYDFNQHGPAKGRRSGLGLQIPPCNPGYKLMTRWGWEEGRGLGANLQGRTEPCLPAYQPLDPDNAKQGLGEQRYKGILPGPAAAVQLRVCLLLCPLPISMFELACLTLFVALVMVAYHTAIDF